MVVDAGNADSPPPATESRAAPPPCVPFIAWRCPACGNAKPKTYGRRGRIRYHECRCGTHFRSIEYETQQLHGAAQAEPIVCLSAQPTAPESASSFSAQQKQRLEDVERRRSNKLVDQDIDEAERVLEGWRVRLAVMRTDRRMVDGAAPLPDDLELIERAVATRPRRAKA